MKIVLKRDCLQEPLFVAEEAGCQVRSAIAEDGRRFPAQKCDGGVIVLITGRAGEEMELTLSDAAMEGGVELIQGENKVEVLVNGQLFTAYQYDPAIAKPYLGPICHADGTQFTRLDLTAQEHPHQRSVICAVGDVNGVDFWNEYGNFGYERHQKITEMISGPAFGRIAAEIHWEDKNGAKFLREERRYTFYPQSEKCRYVDLEITFFADYGPVTFGPTKEAGPLGIRVAEFIRADKGGCMLNSYGARGEAECWSKSAQYCQYEGRQNGKTYGIAAFDNETNERYPTAWHIRDYGLFAANNLYFKGGLEIPQGEKLTYTFRLAFYEGQTDVQNRFNLYLADQQARKA